MFDRRAEENLVLAQEDPARRDWYLAEAASDRREAAELRERDALAQEDLDQLEVAERAAKLVYQRGGTGRVVRDAGQTAMEMLRSGATEESVMQCAATCAI